MALHYMEDADYRALDRMNQSSIKHGLRSMEHMRHAMQNPSPSTPALEFGSLVHTAVLEPDMLNVAYAVAPNVDRRTKGGKQEWADFLECNSDKIVVKEDDMIKARDISASVRKHTLATKWLSNKKGMVEHVCVWDDDDTGVDCKAKIDLYIPPARNGAPVVVDLKTTNDASPTGFAKSVAKFHYHLQAAFYLDGVAKSNKRHAKFVFIAVEKEAPYSVGVYMLDQDAIEAGRKLYKNVLSDWTKAVQSDKFVGYGELLETLSLPTWALPDSDIII